MALTPHSGSGTTVTWRGTSIGEVAQIRYLAGGSFPTGRATTFSVDAGLVEVSGFGTVAVSQQGLKGTLAISSQFVTVTTKAILLSVDIGATVNDAWRVKSTFRIVKE